MRNKVDGLNLISYLVLMQLLLENIDGVVLYKPHLFNKGNLKYKINNFIEVQDRINKNLFNNLFDVNDEKTLDSCRNIDNLFSFVIINNTEFNRKYLRIFNDTIKNTVPKTDEFIITNENDILYDKYKLISELLLKYHDTYIKGSVYENKTLKNQLLTLDSIFNKHLVLKYHKNFYNNFENYITNSNINQQLLFYENLLNHLKIGNNC